MLVYKVVDENACVGYNGYRGGKVDKNGDNQAELWITQNRPFYPKSMPRSGIPLQRDNFNL
ncbi:MAG: hypothetical protein A2Y67_03470 [Candidatus Buchananbacteria bacterium RBG_13_39_9]|uniref:Uncharacterized protein n=1 Tax=Candidatus Buchananbacteria bacterium RBG_13_39_9 TaxID=1797531 RepID=A0A1G1XS62_9BACT|nr:MAG: hypothetical protein A2Y67_03470 [Candidatus Buchananbacteria bacterium RBG_13_39_9]